MGVLKVVFESFQKDKNVVKKYNNIFSQVVVEYMVY
jgi:hypothetical protein